MSRRLLTSLCLIAVTMIYYGSLMPFDLSYDAERVSQSLRWMHAHWPLGPRRVSRQDLLVNVLLYMPLGFLLATRLRGATRYRTLPVLAGVLCGVVVSVSVEALQLLSARRVTAASDVLMNTFGTLLGGLGGVLWGRWAWLRFRQVLLAAWQRSPVFVLAGALGTLLVGDSLFPFLPTLDVSQVLQGLRGSRFDPFVAWQAHPWHHWVVTRMLPWGALVLLLGPALGEGHQRRWMTSAKLVILLAMACEVSKIFILSRHTNVANVLFTALGALLAAAAGPWLRGRISRRQMAAGATLALAGYLAYLEWVPFEFSFDPALLAAKVPQGPEWLPLYHYAMGARFEDVRLFLRNMSLMAGLVYLAQAWSGVPSRGPWRAVGRGALLAGLLGLIFESAQFMLPHRTPSVTDVATMAFGGALGGLLAFRWPWPLQPRRRSVPAPAAQPSPAN